MAYHIVNGISYYAAPEAVSIISANSDMLFSASNGLGLIPLTVMEDSSASFTTSVFRAIVGNYTASDDVFNTGFLQAIYLTHAGSLSATIKYPLGAALTEYGTSLFMPKYWVARQEPGGVKVGRKRHYSVQRHEAMTRPIAKTAIDFTWTANRASGVRTKPNVKPLVCSDRGSRAG